MPKFKKGHIPWNKGKHVQTNTGRTHFKKGHRSWITGKYIQTNTSRTHFKKGQVPHNKISLDEERLIKLYVEEKLSTFEIAEIMKVSQYVIRYRLKRNGIKLEYRVRKDFIVWNKDKPWNEKWREEQSKRITKIWEGDEYRKHQIKVHKEYIIRNPEVRKFLRDLRLSRVYPPKDTSIECSVQDGLKRTGIEFKTHVPIMNTCQTDIFIEPNICVFCDGDFFHANPKFWDRNNLRSPIQIKNLKRDEKANRVLHKNGYIILRFFGDEIRNNLDGIIQQILKVVKNANN